MIRVEAFSKWYGDRKVLSDITLEVADGESLAVIGRSGCGKSTLLRHLAGLEGASTGRLKGTIEVLERVEILKLSEREIQRRKIRGCEIGLLFQDGALFDFLDVEGNILWPLQQHRPDEPEALAKRVREALGMVELEPVDAFLSRDVTGLSGGERKRVALARCLALSPRLMLYDEPTAGLDPPAAAAISSLINRLKDGGETTSVVTSHDMESARKVADRVAWIRDGRVVFQGTFEEAVARPEVREFIEGGSK